MKRSPIKRKTPMRRGPGPKRTQYMRQVSAKQRAVNEERAKLRAELLEERGPFCQCGCGKTWDHMHERLPRGRGGSPVDKDNILCLHHECHDWAHTHPKEAKARGLLE